MIRYFITWRAKRRLDRLVREALQRVEIQQYRKHRQAAKLGWERRRGASV